MNETYDKLVGAVEQALDAKGMSFLTPIGGSQMDSTDVAQIVVNAIWPIVVELLAKIGEYEQTRLG